VTVRPGVFITFEGGEGAGKSTQAHGLADVLRGLGREVVLTREPGGTPGAEAIRALALNPATNVTPLADTLLHFAARADHVERLIRPALSRGAVVICDRFYDSTMAYQGYGMGVEIAQIRRLITLIDLSPDITFILDLPDHEAKLRVAARGVAADRYDLLGADFMGRVAAGFRAIAKANRSRCVTIDAAPRPDQVAPEILGHLSHLITL